jgi:hypothetical protein
MKKLLSFCAISIFVLSLSSCNEDDSSGPSITTFTAAMLMGSNEVPANNSTATGTATLTFNNTTKIFTVTVNHTLASATAGHIHKGAAGTNGGVVFPFATFASPINYTSVALTAEQEADLKANLYYVNLHTAAFAGGEIRGQLIKGSTTTGGSGGGY